MNNSLKKDLLKLKASILQYLQSLRSNQLPELALSSQLSSIKSQIQERNSSIVKDTAAREEKIKTLKHETESKKQEFFCKSKALLSSYSNLESKLSEVEEELKLSADCSI